MQKRKKKIAEKIADKIYSSMYWKGNYLDAKYVAEKICRKNLSKIEGK